MHRHWCDGCNGWWHHDDDDCLGLFGDRSIKACPEHEDDPLELG